MPSAVPFATCGSRSRTGATSVARTACRRRCSATITGSSTARSCSTSTRSRGVARAAVALGVQKLRLTGGEPLVRRDLEQLIAMLAELDAELTLDHERIAAAAQGTGAQGRGARPDHGQPRRDGRRDVPGDERRRLPGRRACSTGIEAARSVGLPVKVNCVVKRGVNEHEIVPMARYFRETGDTLRFIEFMDVGATNGWRMDDVVPAAEIVAIVNAEFPLEPADAQLPRRGRQALALRRRNGRDRDHRLGHAALLRRLHAYADLGRGEALHLPLRASWSRPARADPQRRHRRGAQRAARRDLARPRRPLLRAPRPRRPRLDDAPRVEMSYIGG